MFIYVTRYNMDYDCQHYCNQFLQTCTCKQTNCVPLQFQNRVGIILKFSCNIDNSYPLTKYGNNTHNH